jgi:hypothetical protein
MSIIRTTEFFTRYHLLVTKQKWDAKPIQDKAKIGPAVVGLSWPLVVCVAMMWIAWRIYKLAPRWITLAWLVLYVLAAHEVLTMRGLQAVIGYTFFGFLGLIWTFWYHTVRFRFVRNKAGERIGLMVKGKLVLPLSYPVLTLRKRFRKQTKHVKRVDRAVFDLFVGQNLYHNQNPASYYSVSQNAPGIFQLDVVLPLGWTDEQFMHVAPPILKSGLHLLNVVPLDLDARGGFVTLLLCELSPLDAHLESADAPVLNMTKEQMHDPYYWLPVGIDANAQVFEMPMFLKEGGAIRQLVSGESGAGKSSIIGQQILQASLNPYIDVFITDGKGSEFGMFEPYAVSFVSQPRDKTKGIFAQLEQLETEVARRAQVLAANKASQTERFSTAWNAYDDGNLLLWALDEIGIIGNGMDKKSYELFQDKLYSILSVGRSLGIAAIFSSQTWKSDLLKTQTRDNCFDVSTGFKLNSLVDSGYLGFDSSDSVRPDLIPGRLLKSGRWSSVGQFAIRGLRQTYGKSFFVNDAQIKAALSRIEPVKVSDEPITIDEGLSV